MGSGEYEKVADRHEDYMPPDRKEPVIHDKEYIDGRLQESIEHMDLLSGVNQTKYKRIKRVGIIIGATIPFAVMLTAVEEVSGAGGLFHEGWLKIPLLLYAALGGTLLAVMNNLLKSGSYYDKWKFYRKNSEILLREKYFYLTKMPPYDKEDAFPLIVEKVEEILADDGDLLQPGKEH